MTNNYQYVQSPCLYCFLSIKVVHYNKNITLLSNAVFIKKIKFNMFISINTVYLLLYYLQLNLYLVLYRT